MELKHWLTTLSAELGTSDVTMDDDAVTTLLDLARDSAHEVERVAAPLTTFLVGVAVGRGAALGGGCGRGHDALMNDDSGHCSRDRRSQCWPTSLAPCAACGFAGHC